MKTSLPDIMPDTTPDPSLLTENEGSSDQFLHADQIAIIDEALSSIGEFGEVRLVVEKGRLRFLITMQSHDVLKWKPGRLLNKTRWDDQKRLLQNGELVVCVTQ